MTISETAERLDDWAAVVKEWVPAAVRQSASHEFGPHWFPRVGYTAKAVACLLLGLGEEYGHGPKDGESYPDTVRIAHLNFYSWTSLDFMGPCADFDYLAVGWGVLRGWWYKIGSDGCP